MNAADLVTTYFRLGADRWRDEVTPIAIRRVTAEAFVEAVRSSGRELLFLDRPWTSGPERGVRPYLLHEPKHREYVLYTVDRSTAVVEGRFARLADALLAKARILLR